MSSLRNYKVIVGLGNPGKEYIGSYHNIGFDTLEELRNDFNRSWNDFEGMGQVIILEEERVILYRPTTFMNTSGESLNKLLKKYYIPKENVVVVVDDFNIKRGGYRFTKDIRRTTHGGLRSIIKNFETTKIPTYRIGIGEKRELYYNLSYNIVNTISPFEKEDIDRGINEVIGELKKSIKDELQHRIELERTKMIYDVRYHGCDCWGDCYSDIWFETKEDSMKYVKEFIKNTPKCKECKNKGLFEVYKCEMDVYDRENNEVKVDKEGGTPDHYSDQFWYEEPIWKQGKKNWEY